MIEIRPSTAAPAMIESYLDLFRRCFPSAVHYTNNYLRWLYAENPAGHVVGFDAFDDDHLVAHYVCIPCPVSLDGQTRMGLLSLNTATDPAYQGRGLFVRLANATYEKAAGEGYHLVFGVANANSTHGFINRLGFQHVCSLLALAGIGPLSFDPDRNIENESRFRRAWTPDLYRWRLANEANPVFTSHFVGQTSFSARTSIPGVVCWAERHVGEAINRTGHPPHVARIFLGCFPRDVPRPRFYLSIPQRLRPSPLNLIYRPLVSAPSTIDPASVFFDFLDFDAF